MSKSKTNKTMLAAAVAAIIALGFVGYNMVGHVENAQAVAQTSTLSVAKIEFPGKKISDLQWTSMSEKLQENFKYYTLSGIDNTNLSYTSEYAYAQAYNNNWKPNYPMQLGKGW
jgi:hypothetical protein